VVWVTLISVRNMELTYEWHKAIKLNYKNTRTHAIVVLKSSKHYTLRMSPQRFRHPETVQLICELYCLINLKEYKLEREREM
jgi:hypothetical protein